MSYNEGPLHRAPRPLIGWGGVILIVFCLVFLLIISLIALYALWRWANGQPVDLQGFAVLLSAAVPAGAAIWSLVKSFIYTRRDQRIEEIRAGVPPQPPFDPSRRSPPLSPRPPEGGPRPQESIPP